MSMDFKPGDRVAVVDGAEEDFGRRGKVVRVLQDVRWPIEVEFDSGGKGLLKEDELEFEHVYDQLSKPATEVEKSPDVVNRPPHYAEGWSNGAEVIDIAENLNFNRGNAVKYLARAGKKGGPEKEIEDLKKALWYVRREVERLGGSV